MSYSISQMREKFSEFGQLLQKRQLVAAVRVMYAACQSAAGAGFSENEQAEVSQLIAQAVQELNSDADVRKAFLFPLVFKPGGEKELLAVLDVLRPKLKSLVEKGKDALEAYKGEQIEKANTHFANKEIDQGKEVLDRLLNEFSGDEDLVVKISDLLVSHELDDAAIASLDVALEDSPCNVHLYNQIARILRKLGKFETAEEYFRRAVQHVRHDPNLYFNLGRLYIDWGRFDKALMAANIAIKLDPKFVEAHKMAAYAQSRAMPPKS